MTQLPCEFQMETFVWQTRLCANETQKGNRMSQILTAAVFLSKVFFKINFQDSLFASRTLSKLVTGVTLGQQMLANA